MAHATLGGVSPCFVVKNVSESMAFYCGKLGFESRHQQPEKNPFFAIVGREGTQIFLKSQEGVLPMPNHTRHPWMPWDAFVYVEDPDTLATEFSLRDVAFNSPLQDTHDGLRGFELRDPNDYVLFFGRPR